MRPLRARPATLFAAAGVFVIVACRLWLALTLPLTDTTEARYGEMARKMVETGIWLTPQHDYGVPYLGKPPLAIWLSAIGIKLFGPGEFGPRVFILVAGLGFCVFFYRWVKTELGAAAARVALIVLMSSLSFFVATAAVMTDLVLTVCVSTALLAFWRRYNGGGPAWEATMFMALAFGLLVKGPVAVVLFAAPVLLWSFTRGRSRDVWARIAWLKGASLTILMALPWYAAAEWQNPGFLNYFIVGEHLQRFLVSGWSGDLYGRAHDVPFGTVWLYFLIGGLPWSLWALPALMSRNAAWREPSPARELVWFALSAALTPLLLFTFAANVIFPYALPAVPPAVIAAVALTVRSSLSPAKTALVSGTAAAAVIVVLALVAANGPAIDRHTQRSTIERIQASQPHSAASVYYWQDRRFSAEYYSGGRASVVTDLATIGRALSKHEEFDLVVAEDRLAELDESIRARLVPIRITPEQTVFEPNYAMDRAHRS